MLGRRWYLNYIKEIYKYNTNTYYVLYRYEFYSTFNLTNLKDQIKLLIILTCNQSCLKNQPKYINTQCLIDLYLVTFYLLYFNIILVE